jgi:hypothetical protein
VLAIRQPTEPDIGIADVLCDAAFWTNAGRGCVHAASIRSL